MFSFRRSLILILKRKEKGTDQLDMCNKYLSKPYIHDKNHLLMNTTYSCKLGTF